MDPPYNSPSSEIIYKNGFKHSSWLSLLDGRTALARDLLSKDDGVFICSIDENEMLPLGMTLDAAFSRTYYERNCVTVVHNPKGIQGGFLSINNEYAFVVSPAGSRSKNMTIPRSEWKYEPFRNWGGESERRTAKNCFYPIAVKDGKIVEFGEVSPDDYHPPQNVQLDDGTVLVYPIDRNGIERKWTYARQSVDAIRHLLRTAKSRDGGWDIERTHDWQRFKTVWSKNEYIAGDYGSKPLNAMLGEKRFDFPKAIPLVKDFLSLADDGNSLFLDYFAGSGTTAHAVINLNREDANLDRDADTRRRFILVEQGDYFATVLLPRIKKAIYSPEWVAGQPKRPATPDEAARSPRIIKYLRLESYEDALDSIDFDAPAGELALAQLGDEYLLKYMLNWETKDSPTRLKAAELNRPFDYELQVRERGEILRRKVDLPETFNWLLGLRVHTRQVYHRNGLRYLVYTGETRSEPGQKTVVIWRETAGWAESDYAADRDFIAELPEVADAAAVYLNGNSALNQAGSRAIEPLFKERMFAGVEES